MRDIVIFANLTFSLVWGRTLIPECAYRPWDHLRLLLEKWKHMVNRKSDLGFSGFLLKPFLFIFEEFIEDNICPSSGGPLPGPQGVRMGGEPLPGP